MLTLRSTKITFEEVRDVHVVRIEGRLTEGSGGCETVRELIPRLVKEGAKYIVVDLQKAWKIDDHGLGELICVTNHARWRGCNLAFANLPANFQKLLQKRMVSPFPVVGGGPFDSVDEAVKRLPLEATLREAVPWAVLVQWVKPTRVTIPMAGPCVSIWIVEERGRAHEIGGLDYPVALHELTSWLGVQGYKRIILDLAERETLNSSAISEVVTALREIREGHGEVVLMVSEDFRRVLEVTKMDQVVPVCTSFDEALAILRRSCE